MTKTVANEDVLDQGTLGFTVESRILRELGERLVKQPEVALVELVKNSYDADATRCEVTYDPPEKIIVMDDGLGMTLKDFRFGWMRIGTRSKESQRESTRFGRVITGEKGIGRFAVRFLGASLELRSVAHDPERGFDTLLTASFDWPRLDHIEDLGSIQVPYQLRRAGSTDTLGTTLTIQDLRTAALKVDLDAVRTASIAVVTPYASLLPTTPLLSERSSAKGQVLDPGFAVAIQPGPSTGEGTDVAKTILENAVLRATVRIEDDRVTLEVYRKGQTKPVLTVNDAYENHIGRLFADIRFFPKRKGTFADLAVDGRTAQRWVRDHAGVAVFDRKFRVLPYGTSTDDWLLLDADVSRRARDPRSSISQKHFPMDEATRTSTKLNYMLRLPHREQLIGAVLVEGRRSADQRNADGGLIAAADREGFLQNEAFGELQDVVRGAVEAVASVDREVQQEQERDEREETLKRLRSETRDAIREIENNPSIKADDKARIISRLTLTENLAEQHEQLAQDREESLEVMSLLGVVAGFMTHEFGTALNELEKSQRSLAQLGKRDPVAKETATVLASRIATLREFVTYSRGYIQGAASRPATPYPVKPRVRQMIRVFGNYAAERGIELVQQIDSDVLAPLVPVSLYNGIVLNLYTNALKALIAKSGRGERRIVFKAWNDGEWHYLEVSDTGIGIPSSLRKRVFDSLFTTTADNRDPLGSGMGLGLSLVKRGVESYGGRVDVVDPPAGFSTRVRVKLPLAESE